MGIRSDFIETCPTAANPPRFKKGHSRHRSVEVFESPATIHILIKTWRLIEVGHARENTRSLSMEVEILCKINNEREMGGELGNGCCHSNLPPNGNNRDVYTN